MAALADRCFKMPQFATSHPFEQPGYKTAGAHHDERARASIASDIKAQHSRGIRRDLRQRCLVHPVRCDVPDRIIFGHIEG